MSDSNEDEKYKWEKTQSLGIQKNIAEPLLDALKIMLEHEKTELVDRLNSLKRLGVIKIDTSEMNKKLEEMKFIK